MLDRMDVGALDGSITVYDDLRGDQLCCFVDFFWATNDVQE